VDGVGAVNKMNLEKYDLVLMVCAIFFLALFAAVFGAGLDLDDPGRIL